MSFVGEQIKKYRNIKGMTQQDIADALGESSGRVIYNWEKGIGRPDCDKLARLCDLLGVSADELIGCKSMAQRPTATEVDYLIDSEYKRVTTLARKPKPRMLKIDWFALPASAGTGNILDSDLAEDLFVPESKEAEDADFVISVSGDSMEPTYHDGDKVFVEKCDAVDVGEVGIFVINGDVYIKELGNKCLISHNEKYKPIRIGESDSVYCCGRVIGIVE